MRKKQKDKGTIDMTKAVMYSRVSSREQEQEGYSIDAQQKLLREYAMQKGLTIVKEFCDIESAKASGRTQFGAMLGYLIENPSVKNLLVEKTDRLYRNLKDWVTIAELDLNLHLVKEGEVLNKDSASHVKFIHGIKLLMAKNTIDNLSEEVKKGMKEKASQGVYPSMAPLGYLNKKRDNKNIIEVDSEKGPIVRKLFELYATGNYSLKKLSKEAKKLGLVFRKSGSPLSLGYLEHILKHPIYQGDVPWNGKVYKGQHKELVSRELFEAVQRVFQSHNKPKYRKQDFPYVGLLTCALCGCNYTAEIKKGRYVYYHCTNGKGKCENTYVREEDLEAKFAEVVKSLTLTPEICDWVKQALQESHKDAEAFHADQLKRLQSQYNELQRNLEQVYKDKLAGKIPGEFCERKMKEWQEEQNSVLADIERHQGANRSYMDLGLNILELAKTAPILYFQRSAPEKAKLLKMLLSNCTIERGNLSPVYRKPFDILLEMPKTENWLPGKDSNILSPSA